MTLIAPDIVAEAKAKVGRDNGEKHLHRNLEALVAALNADGTLTADATAMTHQSLVNRSADQMKGSSG